MLTGFQLRRNPNGGSGHRGVSSHKFGENGNQMPAGVKSFPVFILGCTMGVIESPNLNGHGLTRIFQARRADIFVDHGHKTNQAPGVVLI
jgi:hypothetical protein